MKTKPVKTTGAARHARLGPSGYKSREICPSYLSDNESSNASLEGDLLHDVMEKLVARAVKQKRAKLLTAPEVLSLDDERQVAMIEMVVGYVQPLIDTATVVELEV